MKKDYYDDDLGEIDYAEQYRRQLERYNKLSQNDDYDDDDDDYEDYYDEPVKKQPQKKSAHKGSRYNVPDKEQLKKNFGSSGQDKKRKKKKMHPAKKIIIIILIILLLLFILLQVFLWKYIGYIKKADTGTRNYTQASMKSDDVLNILLIGSDTRDPDENGRTDSIILLSVDKSKKKITMTSFMRDCYVNIPGYGWDKLNASYSYGGAGLLMDTIEQNFHVAVDDYVSVNFISFAGIVDAVGGIDIDVSDAEAGEINTILQAEVNEIMGDDKLSDLLTSGGKLHLNGKQALSYARIRHIGNADFERTQRQREVITTVLNEIKKVKPTAISNIMNDVMPQVRSNMNTGQMYMLSLRVPFLFGYDISQLQIPAEDTYWEEYTDSGSSLGLDFDQNYRIIQEKVFADK